MEHVKKTKYAPVLDVHPYALSKICQQRLTVMRRANVLMVREEVTVRRISTALRMDLANTGIQRHGLKSKEMDS